MDTTDLETIKEAKYLGINMHRKLSWKNHISEITTKANQTRQFLQRSLATCAPDVKLQCYKTFVRPIVEYSSTVWDPVGNKMLQNKLESVQKKSVRWICNNWDNRCSSSAMEKKLNLPSLSERREKSRLKMFHNIYHGHKFLPANMIPNRARSKDIRFKQIFGRINSYANSFIPLTIQQWNMLPASIVNVEETTLFERNLASI